MHKILLLFFFFLPFLSSAQDLPRYMTEYEKSVWPRYQPPQSSGRALTSPPNSQNIRAMGEWEEIDAICITWTSYLSTLKEIVKSAMLQTKVIIICSDSSTVKTYLTNNGAAPNSNVKYIIAPFNSVWIRDYGQQCVYTNDVDSLLLIDWAYNRPRPNDDAVPSYIANYFGLPLYQTTTAPYKLIHTGGNFMADGFGRGFSSNLVIDENPALTSTRVDSLMNMFMGIDPYIRMTTLPYDGIHHIDMHIKLLDEETLLLSQYPSGIADGPQIEANLQYILSNYTSVYGTPYKIIRIPVPPNTNGTWPSNGGDYLTYTNSVFVNKTILVPTYRAQYDTTALRIYREALPAGYNVVGINCNTIIQASGALHCITKEVGSQNPLLISHQPLQDTYDDTNPYTVSALIKHRSGIQDATLYYRTDTTQAYQAIGMFQGFNPEYWLADIPAQPAGTRVYYYIEGHAFAGKTQVRPITAPTGYWSFDVLDITSYQEKQNEIALDKIYPNPSKGITVIPVQHAFNQTGQIILKDVLGKTVQIIYDGVFNQSKTNYFINTTNIPAGIYFVELRTDNKIVAQKLIVR